MIEAIEDILYMFYNKSAKHQHRLKELAQMSPDQKSIEDITIETLEHAVEESLKNVYYLVNVITY